MHFNFVILIQKRLFKKENVRYPSKIISTRNVLNFNLERKNVMLFKYFKEIAQHCKRTISKQNCKSNFRLLPTFNKMIFL